MAQDFHNGRRNMIYMNNIVNTPEQVAAALRYLSRQEDADELAAILGLAGEASQ